METAHSSCAHDDSLRHAVHVAFVDGPERERDLCGPDSPLIFSQRRYRAFSALTPVVRTVVNGPNADVHAFVCERCLDLGRLTKVTCKNCTLVDLVSAQISRV